MSNQLRNKQDYLSQSPVTESIKRPNFTFIDTYRNNPNLITDDSKYVPRPYVS